MELHHGCCMGASDQGRMRGTRPDSFSCSHTGLSQKATRKAIRKRMVLNVTDPVPGLITGLASAAKVSMYVRVNVVLTSNMVQDLIPFYEVLA